MEKILEFLEQKKYFMARDEMLKFNEADIAEMFEELFDNEDELEKAVVVYRLLPKDVSVEVFSLLPVDDQLRIVEGINPKELNYIVQELDFDDKIDILEELPANIVNSILENTPKEERHLINAFLNYPEDSAGSLMTPEYISLDKDMTAKEAMAHIKKEGMDAETIYTCYVKDTGRKLIGIVSLSTLVIADDNTKVRDLMRSEFVYLNVYDDQEEVAAAFKKYDFLAMPVVDKEGRLVGIITVDDILDVIEEEDTEDIERMAGIVDVSDSWDSDYLDISVWEHAKNRLPWLLILMVAYIFTGMIVSSYEAKLSQVISLVAYMPMLMGTGGNTGSQASTLIIRGLATGEVELSDAAKILWKEARIGIVVGLILSAFNFLRVVFLDGQSVMIALTICTAMIFIVIIAKLLGSMIPLIVKKIGLDPALIANPFISSISDAVALTIYFAMASLFLGL
ncbi:MAG: magnesium transporter [Firmicutes bacterium]|nr:magnesium transporter [Bacillota bacterium]MBQ1715517.1 magnesium transporter [Bacillota bacterium]MBQ1826317.1 magnesium transporter [Bacillota bacterium]